MLPFEVDPGWYEKYWYSEQPEPKRRAFPDSLAPLAVLAVLLAGGGVVLTHVHDSGNASAYQDWEQE
jgi:hypothetical protein